MKLRIKKKTNKINEEDVNTSNITDPTLVNQVQQLQNDKQKIQDEFNKAQEIFNKAQEDYNDKIKKINDRLAQLMKKQESINAKNGKNNQQTNESFKVKKNSIKLFEGEAKKNLLVDALTDILTDNKDEFSYDLSKDEIRRVARKINDYLTEHKNDNIVWEDIRMVIKNYLIKHNSISFSQSEINLLNDLLEDYILNNNEYKEFNKYFE